MKKRTTDKPRARRRLEPEIGATLIEAVVHRLAQNQRVRRTLPQRGRLHVDRQLPFLCVYRRPAERSDVGTEQMVKGDASYLIAPGGSGSHRGVASLVRGVVQTLSPAFGAFLIVELWAAPDGGKANDPATPAVPPSFTIHAPEDEGLIRAVEALESRLGRIKVLKQAVEVKVQWGKRNHPPGLRPLLTRAEAEALGCASIGVTLPPVYRKANSTVEFPLIARTLRHDLTLALRQAYFEFARARTTHTPPHFHALGRNAVVKAVWTVDRQLASVSSQFDYLLQLTPVNPRRAWTQFKSARFERPPVFHYRPLPVDPADLKRQLYRIPIERVEDPALHELFREKREEVELKLTMLRDRDTPQFLYESLQLFGGVEDRLLAVALDLLDKLPRKPGREQGRRISAERFAGYAEEEFRSYRAVSPDFKAEALVSTKVSGLIVSRGKLLIPADLRLAASRLPSILAHEIGTHLVTYYNGRTQPFQQLYAGLAGYEELQEGLAVLGEHLVGGLNGGRMRQLAARVVAVRHLTDGASFVEAFRSLVNDHHFGARTAYQITLRVYRGGGLTKDAVYLRGLQALLRHLRAGGELWPLLVGKMAVRHIPIIKELQYRDVLRSAAFVPRHLEREGARQRLDRLRKGESLLDLVEPRPRSPRSVS